MVFCHVLDGVFSAGDRPRRQVCGEGAVSRLTILGTALLILVGTPARAQAPASGVLPVARADRESARIPSPAAFAGGTSGADLTWVRLQSGAFRPRGTLAENFGRLLREDPRGPLRVLMAVDGPMDERQRERLSWAGVVPGRTLPGGVRLARIARWADLEEMRRLGVVWVGGFYLEDKVPARVLEEGFGSWAVQPDGTVDLKARYFTDFSDVEVRLALEGVGAVVQWVRRETEEAVIRIAPDRAGELAMLPCIRWVEEVPPPAVTYNSEARAIVQADEVQAAPYGLSGAGVVLGVCDSGEVDTSHEDFLGRIVLLETSAVRPHSTHVAGTMAGSGARSEAAGGTAMQWRGVAPGARIVSFDFVDPIPTHLPLIQLHDGVLSQNSWGVTVNPLFGTCDLAGGYGGFAPEFDQIVTGLYGRRLHVVIAAGNLRNGGTTNLCELGPYGTVGPPATAKNAISVGAVDSISDAMTVFSSWGPTKDGRIKPDLVAPGAQATGDHGVKSTATNNAYGVLQGTSMATPVVSGAIGLLVEDYRSIYDGQNPLPSTVKALLLHTALDLADDTEHYNPGPDYASGYGRLRIQAAVDQLRMGGFLVGEVGPSGTNVHGVEVVPGTESVKFTLVWDDPAALENAGIALVNDLDLVVVDPDGTRHYPWTLDPASPSSPAVRTVEDRRNVVEQVEVTGEVRAGTWSVMVVGHGVEEGASQAYTLALTPPPVSVAPTLALESFEMKEDSGAGSNGNGFMDPGEEVEVRTVLRNVYVPAVTEVSGEIQAGMAGVAILQGSSSYPALAAGRSGTNSTPYRIRVTREVACGTPVRLIQVSSADGYRFTNVFEFPIGEYVVTNSVTANFESADVPLAIPDANGITPSSVVSGLGIAGTGRILDLDVLLRVEHTWTGDLGIELEHPDGTLVSLMSPTGNSGENLGTGECGLAVQWTELDDQAAGSILSGQAPFAGAYRPVGVLNVLSNRPVAGTWLLRVSDHGAGDAGVLQCWGLRISYEEAGFVCTTFNRVPVAWPGTNRVDHDYATPLALVGTDDDQDILVYSIESGPTHGVLTNLDSAAGTVVYVPEPGYVGLDGLTFRVADGVDVSAPALVELDVLPPAADVGLTWSAAGVLTGVGQGFVQVLSVTNRGPNDATLMSVAIELAGGVEVMEVLPSQGSWETNESGLVWAAGGLGVSGNAMLQLGLTGSSTGVGTNLAEVMITEDDPDESDNTAVWVLDVRLMTDLAVGAQAQGGPILLGQATVIDVTVTNQGTNLAHAVAVSTTLPEGLTLLSTEGSVGTWTNEGPGLRWEMEELAPGGEAALRWVVQADQTGNWTNSIEVDAREVDDVPENNATGTLIEVVPAADVVLVVYSSPAALLGQPGILDLRLTNAGPSEAVGVVVHGAMSPELVALEADPSDGSWTNELANWRWELGVIGPGGEAVLHLTWSGEAVGWFTNQVSVTLETADPDGANNAIEVPLEVVAAADLAVEVFSPAVLIPGMAGVVGVVVTNRGPSDATAVRIRLQLANEIEGALPEPDPGLWTNIMAGEWIWEVGDLGVGEALAAELGVMGTTLGWWTNLLGVTAAEADPSLENSGVEFVVNVRSDADLLVTSAIEPETVLMGRRATNRVDLLNAGPNTATEVQVRHLLGAGWQLIQVENASGSWVEESGGVILWQPEDLPAGSNTLMSLVLEAVEAGTWTNVVTAAAAELDLTASNNEGEAVALVVPAADLGLGVAHVPRFLLGSQTMQDVVLTNAGPSDANGVVVETELPAGLVLVGADLGAGVVTNDAGILRWEPGPMAVGSEVSLRLELLGDQLGVWTNVVGVSAEEADPDAENNLVTVVSAVRLETDLAIALGVDASTVPLGQTFGYMVRVENLGTNIAQNILAEDRLPAGVELLLAEASTGQWTEVGGMVRWEVGALEPAQAVTLSLSVRAGEVGSWTNEVLVVADEIDPVSGNDRAEVQVEVVPATDVVLELMSTPVVLLGEPGWILVNVTNAGPSEASSLSVTGSVAAVVQLIGGTVSAGVWTNTTATDWDWDVGVLPAGSNAVLRLDVVGIELGSATNRIVASSFELDVDLTNNVVEAGVEVIAAADLGLSGSGEARILFGAQGVVHRWELTNAGPSEATLVVVEGLLDSGLVVINHTATAGAWSSTEEGWIWEVGTLPSGDGVQLTLELEGVAPGVWEDSASVLAVEADPVTEDNVASVTTAVRVETDLGITQSSGETPVLLGSDTVWDIVVTNAGPNTAHQVVVSSVPGEGWSVVGAAFETGTLTNLGTVVEWRVEELGVGASALLQLIYRSERLGFLTNTVRLAADEIDLVTGNDSAEAVIEAVPSAGLGLRDEGGDLILLGESLIQRVVVTNAGPSGATAIVVRGTMAAGLEAVEGVAETGTWTKESDGTWTWMAGDLEAGSGVALDLTLRGLAEGLWTNTVSVAGSEGDPIPADNEIERWFSVRADADLGVEVGLNSQVVLLGEAILQEVRLTNSGPNHASLVVAQVMWQAEFDDPTVELSAGVWSLADGVCEWTVPLLASGEGVWLRLTGRALAEGFFTNGVGGVSSAQPDLEPLNNEASWTVEVLPAADIAVRVVGQAPELPGPSNLLQVVVTNLGPSLAGGVAVQGSAEDDWSGIQASLGIGTWEVGPEGGWIWELGDLATGAGAVLDLTLDRSQLGDWTNRVVASALQADPDPGNNQATWITRIRLDADLGIAGSAAPDTVLQGGEVVLSLVLTNRGTNVAHEVSAVIALPDATEVVEVVVDAGVWTNEAGALQWRMDDLAVDVTRTLVATLRVHSAGSTTNRVQVTADEVDLMPEDNHLDWQIAVLPAADLLLQMSEGGLRLLGEVWGTEVKFTNAGPATATETRVTGLLPEGLELIGIELSAGTATNLGAGAWTWEAGDLPAGTEAWARLEIRAATIGLWTNVASVVASEGDPNVVDNTAAREVEVVPAANLGLSAGPDELLVLGEEVTHSIVLTNAGPSDALGVEVRGRVLSGLALQLQVSSGGTWTLEPDEWIWEVGLLPAGTNATLELLARAEVIGTWSNQVSVEGVEADPDLSDNSAMWVSLVKARADLGVSAALVSELVLVGRPVVLDVALTNSGPDMATGVVVTHEFPGGLLVDAVEAATGIFTNSPGQVIWTLEEFPEGQEAHLRVTLIPTVVGGLTNEVVVVADVVDDVPENNQVLITWEVHPLAELELELSATASRVMVNDAVRYLLSAVNHAPYTVPGVVLEDILPEGVDLVEAVVSQGTTNLVGRRLRAELGELPSGAVATLLVTVVPRQLGIITNAARIEAPAADPGNPLLRGEVSTQVIRDPPLELSVADGKLSIAWPSVATGFELQFTERLELPAEWQRDPNIPVLNGRRFVVTIKPLTAGRFFRLIRTTP